MNYYQTIIIGGGPSGLMTSITSAKEGKTVLLLEKNKQVGKKLRLTGGGRCNVTNNKPLHELIAHIPGNGKFLYSAFSHFAAEEIRHFFEENGVILKEEDHGRMFPISDQSKTIVETLFSVAKKEKVRIHTRECVQDILKKEDGRFLVKTDRNEYLAQAVVLATGGKTYPSTGSTGDGYRFAQKLGHTITPLYPAESALISPDSLISRKVLQGVSLREVALSALDENGNVLVRHQMDLIFTHFGLSGPAALRCATFLHKELEKKKKTSVSIDCFPEISENLLEKKLHHLFSGEEKSAKNLLSQELQQTIAEAILEKSGIKMAEKGKSLNEKEIHTLAHTLKHFSFRITGVLPLNKAFVTGGGISLKEVNPKTMESKIVESLYFTGEILDYNGYTGGYNITAALSTGVACAKAIGQTIW